MCDSAWLKSFAPAVLAIACSSAAGGGQTQSLTHAPRDAAASMDAGVALAESRAAFDVLAFEPGWSYITGGSEITFSGRALGAEALEIRFGDIAVTPRIASADKLTALAPPHAAGKVWIEVRSARGRVIRLPERFTYLALEPSASESLTSLLAVDSDRDGLSDLEELRLGRDPYDPHDGPDIDGDGIPNEDDRDVDGDGEPNDEDTDIDDDGIPNYRDSDRDGDGRDNDEDPDDDGDGLLDEEDPDDGERDPEEPEEPEPDAGMDAGMRDAGPDPDAGMRDAGPMPDPEPEAGMRDAGMASPDSGASHGESEGETGESEGETGEGSEEGSEEEEDDSSELPAPP
jgi:hypothetical protein